MGWCCCINRVCSVSNCARLLHLSLTSFVFYVLLIAPESELHHAWKQGTSKFIMIILLLSLSTICFLIASLIDPGYEPFPKDTPSSLFTLKHDTNKYIPRESRPYDSSDSEQQPVECTIRNGQWNCNICNVTIQLRSKHCKICQRCVRRFDHHCPWLGNCVGERNHRFFWLFLGLETILLVWGTIMSWGSLLSSSTILNWIRLNILTFSSLIIVFIGCIACTLLFLFHTYLMITGQTTWEMASRFKISYLRDLDPPINPFDEGLCKNVCRFLCIFGFNNWDVVYGRALEKYGPTEP